MSQAVEIERLLVRLVGDSQQYVKMLHEAEQATAKYTIDSNGRLRDMEGRFVAGQNHMQDEAKQTAGVLNTLGSMMRTTALSASRMVGSVRGAMSGVAGQVLAAAGVGSTGGLMIKAVKDASDAQESIAKFNSVFGEHAAKATKFVDDMASNIGRSSAEIRTAMSAYQSFFVGLEFGSETSLAMSQRLQQLTLDFAAFHNISDADAMGRFISAMSGSSEVLDQFGVNIKEAAIAQKLLEMGYKGSAQQADEAVKATARLNIIMEAMGSQGAIGAAARESQGFASQMKAMKAAMTDLSIVVGEQLMPVALPIVQWLKDFASSSRDAVSGGSGFASAIATIADVAHVGLMAFKGLQYGVSQSLAYVLNNFANFADEVIGIVNAIPGIEVDKFEMPRDMADAMQKQADEQLNSLNTMFEGKTPSEWLASQTEEPAAAKKEIDRTVEPFQLEGNFAATLIDAARGFGTEVLDSAAKFGQQAAFEAKGAFGQLGQLFSAKFVEQQQVKQSAGRAIAFGSAEAEAARMQRPQDNAAKGIWKVEANTKIMSDLAQKMNDGIQAIAASTAETISIF